MTLRLVQPIRQDPREGAQPSRRPRRPLAHVGRHRACCAQDIARAGDMEPLLCSCPARYPPECARRGAPVCGDWRGAARWCRDGTPMSPTAYGTTDIWTQVNFYPGFVSADPDSADVKAVADHVDHIANVTGRAQYVHLLLLPKKKTHTHTHTYVLAALALGATMTASRAAPSDLKTSQLTLSSCVLLIPTTASPRHALTLKLRRSRNCTAADGPRTTCAASPGATSFACLQLRRTWRARWRARALRQHRTYTRSAQISRRGTSCSGEMEAVFFLLASHVCRSSLPGVPRLLPFHLKR